MVHVQLPELSQFAVGLMHIQLLHTSASLAINENWDPDVRDDMEMMLNRIVPEDMPFRHSCEGPDDMVSSSSSSIRNLSNPTHYRKAGSGSEHHKPDPELTIKKRKKTDPNPAW